MMQFDSYTTENGKIKPSNSGGFMRKVFILLVLLAAGIISFASVPPGKSILPFDSVKAGMEGTGYTVLRGTEVVSFPVEILGKVDRGPVLRRLIICRIDILYN